MKVPAKGSTVTVEGYGTGLFVKGPNMDADNPEIWLKFEGGEDGDEIVSILWDEFKEKRVYPEQQPSSYEGHNWDELMENAREKLSDGE